MTSELAYPFLSGLIQGAMTRRAPLHVPQQQATNSQAQLSLEAERLSKTDSLTTAPVDPPHSENTTHTAALRLPEEPQHEHLTSQVKSVPLPAQSLPQNSKQPSFPIRQAKRTPSQLLIPVARDRVGEPFAKADSIAHRVRSAPEFDSAKIVRGETPPSHRLATSDQIRVATDAILHDNANQTSETQSIPTTELRAVRVAPEIKAHSVECKPAAQRTPNAAPTSIPNNPLRNHVILPPPDSTPMRTAPAPQTIREPTGGVHIGRVNITVIAETPRMAPAPPASLPTVRVESLHYLRRF